MPLRPFAPRTISLLWSSATGATAGFEVCGWVGGMCGPNHVARPRRVRPVHIGRALGMHPTCGQLGEKECMYVCGPV